MEHIDFSVKSHDSLVVFLLYIPTSLEDLRVKLENEGLVNISYVVVNHQGAQSRREFHLLKERVSDYITVYQQDEQQEDVWTALNGNKDDFLIYDRCVLTDKHGKIFAYILNNDL